MVTITEEKGKVFRLVFYRKSSNTLTFFDTGWMLCGCSRGMPSLPVFVLELLTTTLLMIHTNLAPHYNTTVVVYITTFGNHPTTLDNHMTTLGKHMTTLGIRALSLRTPG